MSTGAISDKNGAYFQAIVPGSTQKLNYSNASVASEALSPNVTLVRVFSNQDCYVTVGDAPVAVAPTPGGAAIPETIFIPGGIIEYFGVRGGQKLAVVRSENDGWLQITEAK